MLFRHHGGQPGLKMLSEIAWPVDILFSPTRFLGKEKSGNNV
jgi:hypothetical protein